MCKDYADGSSEFLCVLEDCDGKGGISMLWKRKKERKEGRKKERKRGDEKR